MLITSILLPFLLLISPMQEMVIDDFRATRPASLPPALSDHRRGAITGITLTSLLVGHYLFYPDTFGRPLWPKDVPAVHPPLYIENRLSRPYTPSLLRTQCIAQMIPTPLAPTCLNKAVNPSFEYAEKSPAPPTPLGRPQRCSLQPTRVFVGDATTFLRPVTSPNIIVFPEPAQPLISPPRLGSLSSPILVMIAALIAIWVWVGLAVLTFWLSVDGSVAYTAEDKEYGDVDMIISLSLSENIQNQGSNYAVDNASKRSGEILASGCQVERSGEQELASYCLFASETQTFTEPPLSPSLPALTAGEPEPSTSMIPNVADPSLPDNVAHSVGPELGFVSPNAQDLEMAPPPTHELPTLLVSKPSPVASSPLLPERSPVALKSSLPTPCQGGSRDDAMSPGAITASPPALRPTATTFIPRSRGSTTRVPVPKQITSVLDTPHPSDVHLLRSSIHAPSPEFDGSVLDSLQSTVHTGPEQDVSVLDALYVSKARSLYSSIHASGPESNTSVSDTGFISQARSLQSSMHAPVLYPVPSVPAPLKPHPALNPAAQAFIPGAPKFFAQSHRPAVVIAPPPPKKRRVRSQHMLEGKRIKREAKEAQARKAAGEGDATGM